MFAVSVWVKFWARPAPCWFVVHFSRGVPSMCFHLAGVCDLFEERYGAVGVSLFSVSGLPNTPCRVPLR